MEEQKKYRIELTEEQLKLVANCLESVSRMYCAQIEPNYHTPLSDKCWNLDTEEKEKVERLFSLIKGYLWQDLETSDQHFGIKYHPVADHLYEMYKQMLYVIEKEKEMDKSKKYTPNVHSSEPLNLTDKEKINVYKITKDILREETIDKLK